MRDSVIEAQGRELAYTDMGDPRGACVFFFHGAPMSRLGLADLHERFAERGLRVISPDRPGYGRSTPQPGRSLTDWPRQVEQLADELGIDRFHVAAHSSGGAYGLVCTALLPERVLGGLVAAGVTDMGWPPAWQGYPQSEAAIMRQPDEDAALAWCVRAFGPDGSGMWEGEGDLPEVDAALFADPEAAPGVKAGLEDALRQGLVGYAQDISVQGRPWGFDPGTVSVPVQVVHGELDTVVPLDHSRHTADLVPGAELSVLPEHGHITILWELPRLLDELRSRT